MKLGFTQPYFFPYIGILQLIALSDRFIIFDAVNYKPKSWMNRNRILHPVDGTSYISVPVKNASQNILIKDALIFEDIDWRNKILAQLNFYKKCAPYARGTITLAERALGAKADNISMLCKNIYQVILDSMDIKHNITIYSELSEQLTDIQMPDEWSLALAEKLRATEYINTPSGVSIFNENKFLKKNIKLSFIQPTIKEYAQGDRDFVPYLSIVDILMWNSKDKVRDMILNDFSLLSYNEMKATANIIHNERSI